MGWVRKEIGIDVNPINVIAKVADFVLDEIVEPVVNVVGNVIDAALDDPIKAIAQIVILASGPQNYWMLPLVEGAAVLADGRDLSDALESTAKAYVTQKIGQYVGAAVGDAVTGAQAGVQAGVQTANEALAAEVIGRGAGAAAVAVVLDRDPLEAFIAGGVSAGVPALLGRTKYYTDLPPTVQQGIAHAVTAKVLGREIDPSVIAANIAAAEVTSRIMKFTTGIGVSVSNGTTVPSTRADAATQAVMADMIYASTSAAFQGRDISVALQEQLYRTGIDAAQAKMKTLKKWGKVGENELGENQFGYTFNMAKDVQKTYDDVDANYMLVTKNEYDQQQLIDQYEAQRIDINGRLDTQETLRKDAETKTATARLDLTNAANAAAANAAIAKYNEYVPTVKTAYDAAQIAMDGYTEDLTKLQVTHAELSTDYEGLIQALAGTTDVLGKNIDEFRGALDLQFVELIDPNFRADEYKKINDLGDDVNVASHWLEQGHDLVNNDKDQSIVEMAAAYKEFTGEDLPDYIIERAGFLDNENRDKFVKNYADVSVADKEAVIATRDAAVKKLLAQYEKAGYSPAEIDEQIESGDAPARVNQIIAEQNKAVQDLRDYASYVGASAGSDSAAYRDAYKDALEAMADTGGYGVTKIDGEFVSEKLGKIDADTLKPSNEDFTAVAPGTVRTMASDSGKVRTVSYVDPVTGLYQVEYVTPFGAESYANGKMKDYSDTISEQWKEINAAALEKIVNFDPSKYSAKTVLAAIGDRDSEIGVGGSAIFGDGSGVSAGLFGGFVPIAFDGGNRQVKIGSYWEDEATDHSGTVYLSDNGYALIAFSNGRNAVIEARELYYTSTWRDRLGISAKFISDEERDRLLNEVPVVENNVLKDDDLMKLGEAFGVGDNPPPKITEAKDTFINNAAQELDYSYQTQQEAADALGELGYNPTEEEAAQFAGAKTPDQLAQEAAAYAAPRTMTDAQAREEMAAAGYINPTDEQVAQFIGQSAEDTYKAEQQAAIYDFANVRTMTEAEAREEMEAVGYINPTDEQVAQFIGQSAEDDYEATQRAAIGEYSNVRTMTEAEARAALGELGYNPTDEEVAQFVGQVNDDNYQASQQAAIGDYSNARMMTEAQARQALADAGYPNPTDAQVAEFVGQANDPNFAANQQAAVSAYADPFVRSPEEVRAEFERLGFNDALDEDVMRLSGRYEQGNDDNTFEYSNDYGYMYEGDDDFATGSIYNDDGTLNYDLSAVFDTDFTKRVRDYTPIATYNATKGSADAERDRRAAEAEAARIANLRLASQNRNAAAQQAQRTQRGNNLNTTLGLLGGSQGGAQSQSTQQSAPQNPDPAKIGYVYDFESIFANPTQEKLFGSPYGNYARGGMVENDVNAELIKMLRS